MREALQKTVLQSLKNLLPHMPVLGKNYSLRDLQKDTFAGATVAAVLVPQSMAYALLAGIPPAHGLYAALIGGIAGSVWSNSRHLATGPIALVSLLTLTAVAPLAPVGSGTFIALVSALALMVGVIQLAIGSLRLGFLVRLVPQSVLAGFSAAAAMVIIATQVPHILGFSVSSGDFAFEQALNIVRNLHHVHPLSFLVGIVSLGLLFVLKKLAPRIPGTLLVLAFGIFAVYMFDLGRFGIKVAGAIPSGLPVTAIPDLSLGLLLSLGSNALMIALISFMSSYAVMKEMSSRVRQKVDADQELIAQGFANIFSGFFRGLPVGGSLSRTAVNFAAGAVTAWSGVIAALFVLSAIVFLGDVLAYLPNAVLASIVVSAVLPLIDFKQLKQFYEISTTDASIAVATFIGVLFLRPDEALLLGVALALLLYLRRLMWTDTAEVGIHPVWNTIHLRDTFPEVLSYPGVLMLRIDAPLFYASVERLNRDIESKIAKRSQENKLQVRMLVLDFSGVTHIDATGIKDFSELLSELGEQKINVFLIELKRDARLILEKGGALKKVIILNNVPELKIALERNGTAEIKDGKHI
jgi:SulP family sulfate permease